MRYERSVSISRDHPTLAGHFPGHPVVPGVVLLGQVLDVLRCGATMPPQVIGFPWVKFASPLKPGEMVTIQVDEEEATLATFSCRVDARLIASGTIAITPRLAAQMERA